MRLASTLTVAKSRVLWNGVAVLAIGVAVKEPTWDSLGRTTPTRLMGPFRLGEEVRRGDPRRRAVLELRRRAVRR